MKTKELLDRPIRDTEEHITDAALEETAVKLLPRGTLLMAIYASPTVGRLGILDTPAACNQACAALLVDPQVADHRFVFYGLLHQRARLQQSASGSAQQNISGRIVKEFKMPFPPLEEQERVALVLGTLDDKIESNRRLAKRLEDVAATLFRARFVDFVGVEEFEESEISRVPNGWRAGTLADLGRFINGRAFTKYASGEGRPILRIKELNDGIGSGTPRSEIDAADENLARHHDILFAWSGSLAVYRWSGPDSLINQHIFKVIPEGYPTWFVVYWIRQHMSEFRAIARDKATTMGHIQRRHLSEAIVSLPDSETLAAADELLGPLDEQEGALAAEGATLVGVRDALLPKLISGEIRVPDTSDPGEVVEPVAEEIAAAAP